MEEEEDKANIQRHVVIERRIEKSLFPEKQREIGEREEKERERGERERCQIRNPPFLTKKTLFFSR